MFKCEQLGISGTGTQPRSNYGQNIFLYGRENRQEIFWGKNKSKGIH